MTNSGNLVADHNDEKRKKNSKGRKAKSRGNGEGSIYRRKSDGRWCGSITIDAGPGGKCKRRVIYGKTRQEVRDKLAELQSQKAAGMLTDAAQMTVGQYLDHWVENISRPTVRDGTHRSYVGIIKKFLKPTLGEVRLDKLSPVAVQSLYGKLEADGVSARRRQMVHAVLRRSLNIAVRQGLIIRNVCQAVDPPKVEKVEMQTLTAEQAQKLLTESQGTPEHALYVLALTCGLRQGEIFALQWSDINTEAGTLSISKSLQESGNSLKIGPPKSKSAIRSLSLPAVAIDSLNDHLQMQIDAGLNDIGLIFCSPEGMFIRKSNFSRRHWKPLLKKCELPNIRFHDLRHTSATLLLGKGVHPKIVQNRLGHSQISLTLDTYSHVLPSMDQAAAELINDVLSGTATPLLQKGKNAPKKEVD